MSNLLCISPKFQKKSKITNCFLFLLRKYYFILLFTPPNLAKSPLLLPKISSFKALIQLITLLLLLFQNPFLFLKSQFQAILKAKSNPIFP